MQRKSRRIAERFLLVLLAAGAGCQRTLPPEPPPEFHGQTVRIACPDLLRPLIETQSRPWQARHDARVEVLASPGGGSPEGVASADVWVFPPADLPRLVAANHLRPVPGERTRRGGAFGWDRLLPLYGEHLLLSGRVPFALPLLGEAPVCVYRADLVASAPWQGRFADWQKKHPAPDGGEVLPLRPPASWEELARQAAFFRDDHPSGTPGPSLPALPADADALDRLFGALASPCARRAVRRDEPHGPEYLDELFSFYFDQKTGRSRVRSPGFVRALELLVLLQTCRPSRAAADPGEALVDGRAVLGIVEASVVARLQRSPMRDKFGICAIPGAKTYFTAAGEKKRLAGGVNRVPYLGGAGWLAGVPNSARQPGAAEDLLADLAGPARAAQIALEPRWGGGPTRVDVLLRERWDAFDLDEARTTALREVLGRTLLQHGLENPVLVLRLANRTAFRDALVAGLRRSLLGKADPAESLAEVDRRWEKLIEKHGAAAHRREYRLGQGLLGD